MPSLASKTRYNMHASHRPSDETDLLIETINKNNYGWKADVCMLQRAHPSYGDHCDDTSLVQEQEDAESEVELEFGKHPKF